MIPHKKHLFDKLSTICRGFNFIPIAQMRDKLTCMINRGKDSTKILEKPNVVYKLECEKCNASYVGETERALMFRVEEHKNDIQNCNYNKVVPMHCTNNHKINPEKAKTLGVETNTSKHFISEMINIHLQEFPLNLKEDTEGLHESYGSLLYSLSNNYR